MPKPLTILNKYFNTDPDNKKSMSEFSAEVKQLSDEDKHELATLAGQELGLEVE